jgi:hypothetical protein
VRTQEKQMTALMFSRLGNYHVKRSHASKKTGTEVEKNYLCVNNKLKC